MGYQGPPARRAVVLTHMRRLQREPRLCTRPSSAVSHLRLADSCDLFCGSFSTRPQAFAADLEKLFTSLQAIDTELIVQASPLAGSTHCSCTFRRGPLGHAPLAPRPPAHPPCPARHLRTAAPMHAAPPTCPRCSSFPCCRRARAAACRPAWRPTTPRSTDSCWTWSGGGRSLCWLFSNAAVLLDPLSTRSVVKIGGMQRHCAAARRPCAGGAGVPSGRWWPPAALPAAHRPPAAAHAAGRRHHLTGACAPRPRRRLPAGWARTTASASRASLRCSSSSCSTLTGGRGQRPPRACTPCLALRV